MKRLANAFRSNCPPIRDLLLIGVLLPTLLACAPRTWMVHQMTDMVETGLPAFEQETDLFMVKQALPAHIKLLETMLASSPQDERLLLLLARLYASYAFAFDEERLDLAVFGEPQADPADFSVMDRKEAKETLNAHYLKAAEYALSALGVRHPDCRRQLSNIAGLDGFLQSLSREDAPALFWYGFALGGWIKCNPDSVPALAKGPLVEKAMQRVVVLQPDYYHGSAHLVLMVFYASRPAMLGGNLALAHSHHRTLKALAGNEFRLADLYFARYYLPQKQDRATFEQILTRVAQAPEESPRHAMLNRIAKARAPIFLKAADRLFEAKP
jgi:hypothetical protein